MKMKEKFSVEKELNGPAPRVAGWQIMVKLKIDEKTKGGILIPESLQSLEKYRTCVGQVVAMGPDAYKGKNFTGEPWCKIGDWVQFKKYDGHCTTFRKIPVYILNDDNVLIVADKYDDLV